MTSTLKFACSMGLALTIAGFATPASAQTTWQQNHPRRTQVNSRLQRQNARIANGEASGRINGAQAAQLHQEHQAIRTQERAEAAQNGGHITKGEQNQLNREENAESRQIYNEKH